MITVPIHGMVQGHFPRVTASLLVCAECGSAIKCIPIASGYELSCTENAVHEGLRSRERPDLEERQRVREELRELAMQNEDAANAIRRSEQETIKALFGE